MLRDIFLAIVQSITEFLPVSSSGHMALFSNLISQPNIFFFTALHLASLVAILIFTRREIADLFTFKKGSRDMWLYLAIATAPAALFGLFFKERIEDAFSSFLFLGIAFIFTSIILLLTRFAKNGGGLNARKALIIGLFQALALFPGVSRSGMTISSALLLGIGGEKAAKFSFLLFMPLSLGAFILEAKEGFYFDVSLAVSLFVCSVLSMAFLSLLLFIVKKGKVWIFSPYCFIIGLVSIYLHWMRYR